MKKFTIEEIRGLFNQVMHEEISFSRMVEVLNEMVSEREKPCVEDIPVRKYKDGDFLTTVSGGCFILKNICGSKVYDHAFLGEYGLDWDNGYCCYLDDIAGYCTPEEILKVIAALKKDGKMWSKDKKYIEDIPKRKFKAGDKVRIKDGISSKTNDNVDLSFVEGMDDLIGETMVVDRYTYSNNYVKCDGIEWRFHEDWIEPYEELKKGDLAIFWDDGDRDFQSIRMYDRKDYKGYYDSSGISWDNAIKFESREQYEKLIKGEI